MVGYLYLPNNEQGGIWKERVVVEFDGILWRFLGWVHECHNRTRRGRKMCRPKCGARVPPGLSGGPRQQSFSFPRLRTRGGGGGPAREQTVRGRLEASGSCAKTLVPKPFLPNVRGLQRVGTYRPASAGLCLCAGLALAEQATGRPVR
jgi:hypothetical protein